MARTFMSYLKEMTGAAAAGGTTTGDVATYARPVGIGPVKRMFAPLIGGSTSARVETYPSKKKKSKRK